MSWVLNKRSRFGDVYRKPRTNEYQARIHSAPYNYLDSGTWKRIVPNIVNVPQDHFAYGLGYRKMVESGEYKAYFKRDIAEENCVAFRVGNHFFRYNLIGVGYLNVSTHTFNKFDDVSSSVGEQTAYNEGTYRNVFQNTDIVYRYTRPRLKENIIIKSLPSLPVPADSANTWLVWAYKLDYGSLDLHPENSEEPELNDFYADRNVVFKLGKIAKFLLPIGKAVDSNGEQTKIRYRIYHKNGNHYLLAGIKYSWLVDASRVFPVIIDASPETINAGFDVGVRDNNLFLAEGATTLLVGFNPTPWIYRAGIDFDTAVIPDIATITQVQITLLVASADVADEIDMDEMTGGDDAEGAAEKYFDASNEAGFYADADGATYLSGSVVFQAVGSKTATLLAQAATDLEDQLPNNWFSIGISATGEDSSVAIFRSMDHNGDDPQLTVTFTVPVVPWLAGWGKRVKATIDHNDVSTSLTHFPTLLYLSTASGIGGDDISFIFDELTLDANRKKIAVTEDDGLTELYVEIEKWDDGNEHAWLWVSLSGWGISDVVDTDIYFYYDSGHVDNDARVGDINDVVAESVWDSSHKAVYHMPDGVDNSSIYDSTSNDNDLDKHGAGEPAEVATGEIGDAQHGDGGDDYAHAADNATLDISGDVTLECWINPDVDIGALISFLGKWNTGDNKRSYILYGRDTNQLAAAFSDDGSFGAPHRSLASSLNNEVTKEIWQYIVGTFDTGDGASKVYVDAVDVTDAQTTDGIAALYSSDVDLSVFASYTTAARQRWFDGQIDEARVSATLRSASWMGATFETGRDHFVDWGDEEEAPAGIVPVMIHHYNRINKIIRG